MSDSVITVENLSKRYVIGHVDQHEGLRHVFENAFRSPLQWLRNHRHRRRQGREDFWALRNVSFEVKRGDVVGIIGRNGAGKSTLLKILSRITEPTTGRIMLEGRMASLLEVGTGFHQELTGRENIFLNGAILGMSKAEIRRKFDEIVAFSEIETFLDTPVKRYSSGMYVRLAFAVAAHLEPEILIVDEVLAVGDAAFQKKCLGKMGEVAKGGRTVLFVSHNVPAVQALCSKAIYLHKGTVRATGPVEPLLFQYHRDTSTSSSRRLSQPKPMGTSLILLAYEFGPVPIESGGRLSFRVHIRAKQASVISEVSLILSTIQGLRLAIVDLRMLGLPTALQAGEDWDATGEISSLPLVEGDYSAGLYINATEYMENLFDLTSITTFSRVPKGQYAPYALCYRGHLELEYTAGLASEKTAVSGSHSSRPCTAGP
jgi:lipopolysaccharide transport system ATP-binding protein